MSKHNGQPPINPNGAGWPSTTEGKSGSGRGGRFQPLYFITSMVRSSLCSAPFTKADTS